MASLCGYEFKDPLLLGQACNHVSADPNCSNARLETLGDLVLALHVGSLIYDRYPYIDQGGLSLMKSVNVDNERLARACVNHNLDRVLFNRIPNFNAEVASFKQEVLQYPVHSSGRVHTPKYLADMIEALIGAVWIDTDKNLVATGAVIDLLIGPLITNFVDFGLRPIHRLHQCKLKPQLEVHDDSIGGKHRCTIMYRNAKIASVIYWGSKEGAQNRAAAIAFEYFNVNRLQI